MLTSSRLMMGHMCPPVRKNNKDMSHSCANKSENLLDGETGEDYSILRTYVCIPFMFKEITK